MLLSRAFCLFTFCSPVSGYFASASKDRCARIWTLDRIVPVRTFAQHTADVNVRIYCSHSCNPSPTLKKDYRKVTPYIYMYVHVLAISYNLHKLINLIEHPGCLIQASEYGKDSGLDVFCTTWFCP